jgi:anti-sigma regulatory factor (Ser/Thr protein kinase)
MAVVPAPWWPAADVGGIWLEVFDPAGTLTWERFQQRVEVPLARRGYGLWVISRLCDEVLIDHPAGGSRLLMRLAHRLPASS